MTAFAKTIPVLDTSKPSIKQKGYSIIELSIALAIISIILVTALAGVQRILRSNNVNEDLKNINLVASKLAVMLSSVPDTAGMDAVLGFAGHLRPQPLLQRSFATLQRPHSLAYRHRQTRIGRAHHGDQPQPQRHA
jgi:prepilin-type N-terminal cleavage/methylation domain-containing protein